MLIDGVSVSSLSTKGVGHIPPAAAPTHGSPTADDSGATGVGDTGLFRMLIVVGCGYHTNVRFAQLRVTVSESRLHVGDW